MQIGLYMRWRLNEKRNSANITEALRNITKTDWNLKSQ